MTKLPTKFPAKGWRKVRVGNKIRATDVWYWVWRKENPTMSVKDHPYRDEGQCYLGVTPLYRKIKTKKGKKK